MEAEAENQVVEEPWVAVYGAMVVEMEVAEVAIQVEEEAKKIKVGVQLADVSSDYKAALEFPVFEQVGLLKQV